MNDMTTWSPTATLDTLTDLDDDAGAFVAPSTGKPNIGMPPVTR